MTAASLLGTYRVDNIPFYIEDDAEDEPVAIKTDTQCVGQLKKTFRDTSKMMIKVNKFNSNRTASGKTRSNYDSRRSFAARKSWSLQGGDFLSASMKVTSPRKDHLSSPSPSNHMNK